MCGRFTLRRPGREIAEHFGLGAEPRLAPRYNVAPGQSVAVVRVREDGARVAEPRRWGLVPAWADDLRIGSRLINARSETAARRKAFAPALRTRRCLIPADGFYEWAGRDGQRVPFHLEVGEGELFGMAGLYETWHGPGGEVVESCTILTRAANPVVAALHDRMPVILSAEVYAAWLDPSRGESDALASLAAPPRSDAMRATAVSTRVNRVEHDDAECLDPPVPSAQGSLF